MRTILYAALVVLFSTLIIGCGGSGTTGSTAATGTVALNLTDAPIDDEAVEGVYITFDSLRYQYVNTDENNESNESRGWKDVDLNGSITVNLLALQDGNSTLLNKVELPAGEIQHIRFMIDTSKCYVQLTGNIKVPLEVPSGTQTGYKSVGGFTIPAGGTVNVTADFDLRKSVTLTGNGRYILRPTIKIIDNVKVGEINGSMMLDANGSSIVVYAYGDGDWNETEVNTQPAFANAVASTDATDGSYVLPWLTTGTYDLIVVSYDNTGVFETILGYIDNANVITDSTTIEDITSTTLLDTLP